MGKTFDELMYSGPLQPSRFGKPLRNAEEEQQSSKDEHAVFARNDAVRRREGQVTQAINRDMAQEKKLKEQFGTDDPTRIAAIKASGGLDLGNLKEGMQSDPEGTRAKFERALALAGKGGVQDLPDSPPERDYYRQEDNGTLAFGNTAEFAADPRSRRYNSDSGKSKDLAAPGGTFSQDRSAEVVAPQSPEDILFEGKVDQARTIVEKPERQMKHAAKVQEVFDGIFNESPDIKTARETVKTRLLNGDFGKLGLTVPDVKIIERELLKRGKSPLDLAKAPDKEFYKPFVKAGARPGQAADLAEPPSVVNPGGGTSETTKVKQNEAMAANDAALNIEETMPSERTKAYDYARGKVAKQAGTKKVARGGKGGGMLDDISGFLEGEGRAGSGESGPMGVAKDLASFYGPRMPGDILSAIGGVGAGGIAKKGAKGAMKIRAIENMFGKF